MNHTIVPLRTMLLAFPGIPVTEANELIASGKVRSYPANTVLCHEDAVESTFYIVLQGQVQVTKLISEVHNQVRLLNTLKAGDFFGEMALLQDAPRAASVTTTEPTTVLEIRKEHFNELMRSSASMSRAMVQEVVRRLRENDAMAIEDLRIKAGELAAAYQQLAEQEYARREFLTTIAHELRTPLTAANGFLQMVEMWQASGQSLNAEAQQAAIKTASRHIQQIITLVNDILFVQEMDLILPHFSPTDLPGLLRTVAERGQARLLENNVRLVMDIHPGLPPVSGDARSLERAFGAILDNAIKFSYEDGQVEIAAGQQDRLVWVEIRDHGVGIPEDIRSRIFDRFFHIDQIEGRMFRGLGLGLSIARQVIEQHQGKIEVYSQPGKGTTVRISLNPADSPELLHA